MSPRRRSATNRSPRDRSRRSCTPTAAAGRRRIDAVESLAPDGFDDVEQVLEYAEREAIVRGDAQKAGFAVASHGASKATARGPAVQTPTTARLYHLFVAIDALPQ